MSNFFNLPFYRIAKYILPFVVIFLRKDRYKQFCTVETKILPLKYFKTLQILFFCKRKKASFYLDFFFQ